MLSLFGQSVASRIGIWFGVICAAVLTGAVLYLLIKQVVRHRYRFTLRTLLLFVLLSNVLFSWIGVKVERARREAAILRLLDHCGPSLYEDRTAVQLNFRHCELVTDRELAHIGQLSRLTHLSLS